MPCHLTETLARRAHLDPTSITVRLSIQLLKREVKVHIYVGTTMAVLTRLTCQLHSLFYNIRV